MPSFQEQLQSLRDALLNTAAAPFCSGTCPIPSEQTSLFYCTEPGSKSARRVILSTDTSAEELKALAEACDAAGENDMRDDSDEGATGPGYTLDPADFASKFEVEASGLVDLVSDSLTDGKKSLSAELHDLAVYGKDSSGVSHRVTTDDEDETIFGSLVIVLPAPHDGGKFVFRRDGQEYTFDPARELAQANDVDDDDEPSVCYIAFPSSAEHEISPVLSGYRVALTYRLHVGADKAKTLLPARSTAAVPMPSPSELAFAIALDALLADASFLPTGGRLLFGLQHAYPDNLKKSTDVLEDHLKGGDALLNRVCTSRELDVQLMVIYAEKSGGWRSAPAPDDLWMADHVVDLSREEIVESDQMSYIMDQEDGEQILHPAQVGAFKLHRQSDMARKYGEAHWVTEMTGLGRVRTKYIGHDHPHQRSLKGEICVLVYVGKAGARATL
ncbi:hypothetical protein PLICRDRAFT_25333 [Plicaturopsis crispa FD-325 SS-3]|nr:hypothetical protein PLICRDRAFT_25333 [Plicaturopsis crispa FD-325 SS-3]